MIRTITRNNFLLPLLFALVVSACTPQYAENTLTIRPLSELYEKGLAALKDGDHEKAVQQFRDVQTLYPYSEWAGRAQLLAAYSYFANKKYNEALYELESYIDLYPSSDYADYAMFMRAQSYFEQVTIFERDQKITELARSSLLALVNSFPSDNKYVRSAFYKLVLIDNHLAGKELDIGRHYLRREKFSSAINRFRLVLTRFPNTIHVPEALFRMVESYTSLGLDQEAKQMLSVLYGNFPGSAWYSKGYELLNNYDILDAS